MAGTMLGIDIGHDSLKLALVKGGTVRRTAVVRMPQNLFHDNRVASVDTMGELIRRAVKENGLRCKSAALALPNETVFTRSLTMPLMTIDQLEFNLPFEFGDFITDDLSNYVFDYEVISVNTSPSKPADAESEAAGAEGAGDGESGGAQTMDLMAVAAPKQLIEDSREIMRKAGMKLAKAAPAVCAFQALIREAEKNGANPDREYCIIDMGYSSVRMDMFRGDRHIVTRALETGMRNLDTIIADAYSVDPQTAHTYLISDHDGCQNKDYCINAYNDMAVELMRAVNFYRFSNPDSQLEDIWICGGGACIEPLRSSIAGALDMNIHPAGDLIPGNAQVDADYSMLQAIGIALS